MNRAPALQAIQDYTNNETQLVRITPNATDANGDNVTYYYSFPLNSSGMWQTSFNDAGSYKINVTASDGDFNDTKIFTLTVLNVNRTPALQAIQDYTSNETQLVKVKLNATDADGDNVTYYYSFPLNSSGMWLTSYTDAGVYDINVTASDGKLTDTESLTLTVLNVNRAPQIQPIDNFYANETDLITLIPNATNPDGNNITYEFSLPLNSSWMWQTAYGDKGSYNISITTSDGSLNDTE